LAQARHAFAAPQLELGTVFAHVHAVSQLGRLLFF
jgi:hypothetical protein